MTYEELTQEQKVEYAIGMMSRVITDMTFANASREQLQRMIDCSIAVIDTAKASK